MDEMQWLEKWFQQNCDGQWEQFHGIEIGTLDNPGWYVNIDLNETQYQSLQMGEIREDRGDHDWIRCIISDGIYKGSGDSTKLKEIVHLFIKLIESS